MVKDVISDRAINSRLSYTILNEELVYTVKAKLIVCTWCYNAATCCPRSGFETLTTKEYKK